ncbi:unnamed protein product [Effrenium voratum]|uniref:Uncharacterized protein n=1 Tax=Effrenium voratum TaxID=2562239 RepID=A0AA36J778_9DINO|nr:unnamed protein product [Effrenium voratum]
MGDVDRSPDIYLCDEKETMIYHWSGTEAGMLASPYNSVTDVIVTTDRVFLWQRPLYKAERGALSASLNLRTSVGQDVHTEFMAKQAAATVTIQ